MAEKKLKTLQFEGLNTTYVLPEVDPTSSISGDAADAKIVGDHLTDINNPHGVTLEQLGASKTIVTDENEDGHIILKSYLSDSGSGNISTHISDRSNPHKVTAAQVGADVSGAAKQALEDAKGYTDEVITNLIGGAPDTLNTLQELAEAMGANAEVVEVLEKAITGKADNSVLTTHIDNKNNPHNVTIDQIGAAPSGLITELINVANEGELETVLSANFALMRNRTMAHFYINPSTMDVFNGKATLCELTCWTVTDGGYGFARFTSYGKPNVIISYKALYGGVWQPMEDGSTTAFAPSGYGLGGNATEVKIATVAELDSCKKNGWYAVWPTAGTLYVGSIPFNTLLLEVSFLNDYYGWQIVRTLDNYVLKRKYHEGHWSEWEFENPPMQVDVEYRTTERWNGKPVYAKHISYTPNGTLGDENVMTDITIPHGISGFGKLVRINGTVSTYQFPVVMANGGTLSISQVSVSAIVVRLYKCTAASTMYFDLYYTK